MGTRPPFRGAPMMLLLLLAAVALIAEAQPGLNHCGAAGGICMSEVECGPGVIERGLCPGGDSFECCFSHENGVSDSVDANEDPVLREAFEVHDWAEDHAAPYLTH